jgi:hypothetical protein
MLDLHPKGSNDLTTRARRRSANLFDGNVGSVHWLTAETAARYHIAYTVIDANTSMANPDAEPPRFKPPEPRAPPRSAPPTGTPYTVNSLAYLYADQFSCLRKTNGGTPVLRHRFGNHSGRFDSSKRAMCVAPFVRI